MSLDEHRQVESEYGIVRESVVGAPVGGDRAQGGPPARYRVEITVPGACEACAVNGNCYGTGSLVEVASDEELRTGETVRLEMRRGTVLKATAWVYGIPLVAIVAGTVTGYLFLFAGRSEMARVLLSSGLGVGLMAAAGFVLARLNTWIGRRLTIRAVRLDSPAQTA